MSSFLTKEQLDKYVKDLASKSKTTALNTQSKSSPLSKVPPNRPLSPTSPSTTTSSSSILTTSERKVGVLYGPRSPPPSNRNSLTASATTSPRTSTFNIDDDATARSSLSNISDSSPLDETVTTTSTTANDSTNTLLNSNEEKKSKYKSIDDIVNDLSYPMETKLSFEPTTTTTTTTTSPPQSKGNNIPPPKGADDSTKGSYVLSAAFRSSYGAASRTPSVKKPVIQPSPKQEQHEISLNKKNRDSTIQELQNRSDTDWKARYDETQRKYPPLDKLDPPQNKNNLINSTNSTTGEESPQNKNNEGPNSNPLTTPASNIKQTIRSSSLDCASCGKPISGNVLSAMGKKWHPDHFICKKCGITLEHVAFFEKDGHPYCHLDFHELFSPRCGHCDTPIIGQAVNALGKSWHPEHFFCRECGDNIGSGFMVHDGFPYCEKDWMRLFAPKCKGCKENIKGEFMKALDGMWHRSCFVCKTCKEPFYSSYHYVFEGNPYCDTHYKELL